MRRHLVQERGEFPASLQEAFQNMEVTGSPYDVSNDQRLNWAEGLDVPLRAETERSDVRQLDAVEALLESVMGRQDAPTHATLSGGAAEA